MITMLVAKYKINDNIYQLMEAMKFINLIEITT